MTHTLNYAMNDTSEPTAEKIEVVCDQLKGFLLEKNKRYGDSALYPQRIFSHSSAQEQIMVRLDDKLSRIKNADKLRKNDVVDLAGYLVILMISNGWHSLDDLID